MTNRRQLKTKSIFQRMPQLFATIADTARSDNIKEELEWKLGELIMEYNYWSEFEGEPSEIPPTGTKYYFAYNVDQAGNFRTERRLDGTDGYEQPPLLPIEWPLLDGTVGKTYTINAIVYPLILPSPRNDEVTTIQKISLKNHTLQMFCIPDEYDIYNLQTSVINNFILFNEELDKATTREEHKFIEREYGAMISPIIQVIFGLNYFCIMTPSAKFIENAHKAIVGKQPNRFMDKLRLKIMQNTYRIYDFIRMPPVGNLSIQAYNTHLAEQRRNIRKFFVTKLDIILDFYPYSRQLERAFARTRKQEGFAR